MKHCALVFAATLIVMTALDMLWIGVIARGFYKSRIDNLAFQLLPAVLFYLMYAAGVVIFVNGGEGARWQSTLVYGALFGAIAYATYDLTNLATLKGWSVTLSVVDIIWGVCVTAVSSTCGLLITQYIER